ncbi:hypothetical protein BpHYR1_022761 [Brachionus plicatilis]|uniref:Uncharacterized protein n=1 Tax=Brachionus plicatilis TaxID=10195 RepID=A0A3M7P8N3_BRAPC|nr:hypothetical protein BpHYR1_022761 [Brachionus plicatilis]
MVDNSTFKKRKRETKSWTWQHFTLDNELIIVIITEGSVTATNCDSEDEPDERTQKTTNEYE